MAQRKVSFSTNERRIQMKKLLALFAMLPALNCGSTVTQNPSVGEEPLKGVPPSMYTIGFHDNIDWACRQEDYTNNLVWISCKFENRSLRPQRECIRVIISDASGKEVERSRVVCSNLMQSGEVYENYVSVYNSRHSTKRTELAQKCGLDNGRCTLSTEIAHPDY